MIVANERDPWSHRISHLEQFTEHGADPARIDPADERDARDTAVLRVRELGDGIAVALVGSQGHPADRASGGAGKLAVVHAATASGERSHRRLLLREGGRWERV